MGETAGTTPVVPWAQATTGHPPSGAAPAGAATTPDTAMGDPSGALDVYSTRHASLPLVRLPSDWERMMVPGGPAGSSAGGV